MKKRLTPDEIRALQEGGAKVQIITKDRPPKPVEVVPDTPPSVADVALAQLVANMNQSQRAWFEQLQQLLEANAGKPTSYRFIIKRDRKGLIETIDAIPAD